MQSTRDNGNDDMRILRKLIQIVETHQEGKINQNNAVNGNWKGGMGPGGPW